VAPLLDVITGRNADGAAGLLLLATVTRNGVPVANSESGVGRNAPPPGCLHTDGYSNWPTALRNERARNKIIPPSMFYAEHQVAIAVGSLVCQVDLRFGQKLLSLLSGFSTSRCEYYSVSRPRRRRCYTLEP